MVDPVLLTVVAHAHVLSAVTWLGSTFFAIFVLVPGVRNLFPAANGEFTVKVFPRILRFVEMTGGSTIVFGVALLYLVVGGDFTLSSATSSRSAQEWRSGWSSSSRAFW